MTFIENIVAELGVGMSMLVVFFGILLIWKIFERISFRRSEKQDREWKSRQDKEKGE